MKPKVELESIRMALDYSIDLGSPSQCELEPSSPVTVDRDDLIRKLESARNRVKHRPQGQESPGSETKSIELEASQHGRPLKRVPSCGDRNSAADETKTLRELNQQLWTQNGELQREWKDTRRALEACEMELASAKKQSKPESPAGIQDLCDEIASPSKVPQQIRDLQCRNRQLEDKNRVLEMCLGEVRKEYDLLQPEIADMVKQNAALTGQLEAVRTENRTLNNKVDKLESAASKVEVQAEELMTMQKNLEASDEERKALISELEATWKCYDEACKEKESAINELKGIDKRINSSDDVQDKMALQLQEISRENMDLQHQLTSLNEERKAQHDKAMETNASLRQANENLIQQHKKSEAMAQEMGQRFRDARNEVNSLRESVRIFEIDQQKIVQERQRHHEAMVQCQQECHTLQRDIEELRAMHKDRDGDYERQIRKVQTITDRANQLQQENLEIHKSHSELVKTFQETKHRHGLLVSERDGLLHTLKTERLEWETQSEAWHNSKEAWKTEKARMENEAWEKARAARDAWNAEKDEMQRVVGSLRTQKGDLMEEGHLWRSECMKAENEVTITEEEARRLHIEQDALCSLMGIMETKALDLQSENQALKVELGVARKTKQGTVREMEVLKAELEREHNVMVEGLQRQKRLLEVEMRSLEAINQNSKGLQAAQVEALEAQLAEAQEVTTALELKLIKAQETIKVRTEERDLLAAELENLRDRERDVQNHLDSTLSQSNQRLQNRQAELNALRKSNEQLLQHNHDLRIACKDASQHVELIQEEGRALREQVQHLQDVDLIIQSLKVENADLVDKLNSHTCTPGFPSGSQHPNCTNAPKDQGSTQNFVPSFSLRIPSMPTTSPTKEDEECQRAIVKGLHSQLKRIETVLGMATSGELSFTGCAQRLERISEQLLNMRIPAQDRETDSSESEGLEEEYQNVLLKAKNDSLQQEVATLHTKVEQLLAELESTQQKNDRKMKKLPKWKQEAWEVQASLEDKVKLLEEEKQRVENEKRILRLDLQRMKESTRKDRKEKEAFLKMSKGEKQSTSNDLEITVEENKKLQTSIHHLESAVSDLSREKQSLEKTISALQAKLANQNQEQEKSHASSKLIGPEFPSDAYAAYNSIREVLLYMRHYARHVAPQQSLDVSAIVQASEDAEECGRYMLAKYLSVTERQTLGINTALFELNHKGHLQHSKWVLAAHDELPPQRASVSPVAVASTSHTRSSTPSCSSSPTIQAEFPILDAMSFAPFPELLDMGADMPASISSRASSVGRESSESAATSSGSSVPSSFALRRGTKSSHKTRTNPRDSIGSIGAFLME